MTKSKRHFDGETYVPSLDQERLSSQFERVFAVMMDAAKRPDVYLTYSEIGAVTGDRSENAISARIRDLRKEPFNYTVVSRRRGDGRRGLFEFRLILGEASGQERLF